MAISSLTGSSSVSLSLYSQQVQISKTTQSTQSTDTAAGQSGEVQNNNSAGVANSGATQSSGKSLMQISKEQLNVQILQASAQVSINAGDNSQTLVLNSAIDRINEILSANGVSTTQTSGTSSSDGLSGFSAIDTSPEATSQRILSFATAFYSQYAEQNPDKDAATAATDFVSLVRGGFEKGYNEAKDILESLKVWSGDVQSGIEKTFSLVQQGFDSFLQNKLDSIQSAQTATEQSAAADATSTTQNKAVSA